MTGRAMSSEVSLTMAMVSLPVGGTMTRIACGSTMRRIVLAAGHAERLGGLGLAAVDREDAGARDLGHVGGLGQPEAEDADPDRGAAEMLVVRPA